MANTEFLENTMPVAPVSLIVLESSKDLGALVDKHLSKFRKTINQPHLDSPAFQGYIKDSYLTNVSLPRFGSGEGKGVLLDSVRGTDVFILLDVMNHSLTYQMNGFTNHFSPDNHYQDLKRVIAAIAGKAHRINVIMPFLYESRQHKRSGRESLDAAMTLAELADMGVKNIITFDAHDPSVANATPISGFDNFTPFYQFVRALLNYERDLIVDKDHLVVISPDEGALHRAIYLAGLLGVNTGMFYKRRDYTTIVNGKNPIVAHEFLGDNIDGKDVIIVDDMIASGESMLDTARQLKGMNAKRVFIFSTFGLFTNGLASFDKAYEDCVFDKVITTNLTYRDPALLAKPYYIEADMSKFMASIIDFLNHDVSMGAVMTPTDKITKFLEKYNAREEMNSEDE